MEMMGLFKLSAHEVAGHLTAVYKSRAPVVMWLSDSESV